MRFRAGASCRACALGGLLFAANIFCGVSLAGVRPRAKQTKSGNAAPRTTAGRSLHLIGEKISKAVLEKDIPTLLAYDRADLRSADKVSLKNTKGDLYCYIFDSECITWGSGNWRSVYDKLSQAHQLQIKVSVSSSPYDRQTYGNLFFYDASAVSEKDLRSRDYLCKEGPANITTWKFRLENGKWKPVTPLFDSETRDCPSDVQGDEQ
jgi:hypothetical protein